MFYLQINPRLFYVLHNGCPFFIGIQHDKTICSPFVDPLAQDFICVK